MYLLISSSAAVLKQIPNDETSVGCSLFKSEFLQFEGFGQLPEFYFDVDVEFKDVGIENWTILRRKKKRSNSI